MNLKGVHIMSVRDKNYWDDLYGSDKGSIEKPVSQFLEQALSSLKKGKAMDIACGTGSNSFFLAENGFTVEGIDFSKNAIDRCKSRSGGYGTSVDFKVQSLDFFLMPIQKYDTVIITDFKASPRLIDEIKKGLTIGGTLLLDVYTLNHLKENPSSDLPAEECYKAFELARVLKDWNLLYYDERVANKENKVRVIAVKPSY